MHSAGKWLHGLQATCKLNTFQFFMQNATETYLCLQNSLTLLSTKMINQKSVFMITYI